MITSAQALKKYGDPNLTTTQSKWFELWQVEKEFLDAFNHVKFSALGTIGFPKKIFINKDFKPTLKQALQNLIDRKLTNELKTLDDGGPKSRRHCSAQSTLQGDGPAEEGRSPVGRGTQPRPHGQALEIRRQRAPARRTDQRSRRRYAARAGRGARGFCRLRRYHQP